MAEAVQETPARRGRGRRRMKETQLEGKKEEEEISEEGLTQSLQKRDQNIQENKAMVGIPPDTLPLFILPCWHQRLSDFLVLLLCFSWPSFLQI